MNGRVFGVGLAFLALCGVILAPGHSAACTRVVSGANGKALLVGRSLDWVESPKAAGADLVLMPRGVEQDGLAAVNSLKWTSKYGSVVTVMYDGVVCDGLNEEGLVANVLYLHESDYGTRDESRPGLALSMWGQFTLDNFATVAEAVEFFRASPLQPLMCEAGKVAKMPAVLHMAITDQSGDSAVFEYLKGKVTIHHDPSFGVMTNSPPFDEQLANLKAAEADGFAHQPGSNTPADRFVRASYYARNLPKAGDVREAVAGVLSVLRNVSQPLTGVTHPGEPNSSPTYWRTVADLSHLRYDFESATSPNLVWVDLGKLDLAAGSGVRRLDLVAHPDLVGEVSASFRPGGRPKYIVPSPEDGGRR